MKVAIAQMDVKAAMPQKNLESMLRMAKTAKENGADIICFSEQCLGGYLVGDKWTDDDYVHNLIGFNAVMQEVSKHIPVIYGNIYVDERRDGQNNANGKAAWHPNKDGRSRKFNAIYAYQNGKPVSRTVQTSMPDGVEAKTLLPNYRMFDDVRYFFSKLDHAIDEGETLEELAQPFVFNIGGKDVKIGLQMCEDTWDDDYRKNGEAINVSKMLVGNGAEYIFNLSCSPWTVGKNSARDRKIKRSLMQAKEAENEEHNFKGFFYVNNTGAQNNGKNIITFDGGSTVYNRDGDAVAFANVKGEDELLFVQADDIPKMRPMSRLEEKPIAQIYRAKIQGIRHMKDIMGVDDDPKWLAAVSGGVDSAVGTALLVNAVGTTKVAGVNYPTKYNGEPLKDVARELCDNLGIAYSVVPIQEVCDVVEKTVRDAPIFGKELNALHKGNMMAKARISSIHSTLAAANGALYPNFGNKTELMIGYFTLDADGRGHLGILSDLTKDQVIAMGYHINELAGKNVIPERILKYEDDITFYPSAELETAQKDPIHIPYHGPLTGILMDYKKVSPADVLTWYMDGTIVKKLGMRDDELLRAGLDTPIKFVENLEWFTKQKETTVFKRVQTPPGIIVSKTAFGFDLRESMLPYVQTEKYKEIKAQLLGHDYARYGEANAAYKNMFD
jgi:NAD+ synthase (glutamine-hydrolysing)